MAGGLNYVHDAANNVTVYGCNVTVVGRNDLVIGNNVNVTGSSDDVESNAVTGSVVLVGSNDRLVGNTFNAAPGLTISSCNQNGCIYAATPANPNLSVVSNHTTVANNSVNGSTFRLTAATSDDIEGNQFATANGLSVWGSHNVMKGNHIIGNTANRDGIMPSYDPVTHLPIGSNSDTLVYNTAADLSAQGSGITVSDNAASTAIAVSGSSLNVTGNAAGSISIMTSSNGTVAFNTANQTITVQFAVGPTVTGNAVNNSITLYTSNYSTVTQNNVSNYIYVGNGVGMNVTGNVVKGTPIGYFQKGVITTTNYASNDTVAYNSADAIFLYSVMNSTVTNNNVSGALSRSASPSSTFD